MCAAQESPRGHQAHRAVYSENRLTTPLIRTGDRGSGEFREAWEGIILPGLAEFKPEFLLISAGFDAHWRDPLGGLALAEGQRDALYVLDEPTTGLHPADIRVLLGCLDDLIDLGGTVIVIEHNLDIIRQADFVMDLGPGGGPEGGMPPELAAALGGMPPIPEG